MSDCCSIDSCHVEDNKLKKVLYIVLFINAAMFVVEAISGFIARSNALLADSLDMLGDAFVYGASIVVLAKSKYVRAKTSLLKGVIMLALGLFVVGESFYKILYPIIPAGEVIAGVGIVALIANIISFGLLIKYKGVDLNIRSSWICSRNDLIANTGVIVAGLLVIQLGSMWPDIIAGFIIAFIIIQSSIKIILDSRKEMKEEEDL